jgi:hypothetical protein
MEKNPAVAASNEEDSNREKMVCVGVPEPAKSVRFNLDLATQREG